MPPPPPLPHQLPPPTRAWESRPGTRLEEGEHPPLRRAKRARDDGRGGDGGSSHGHRGPSAPSSTTTSLLEDYLRSELRQVASGRTGRAVADAVVASSMRKLLSHYGDEASFFALRPGRTPALDQERGRPEPPAERRERVRSLLSKYLAKRDVQ